MVGDYFGESVLISVKLAKVPVRRGTVATIKHPTAFLLRETCGTEYGQYGNWECKNIGDGHLLVGLDVCAIGTGDCDVNRMC